MLSLLLFVFFPISKASSFSQSASSTNRFIWIDSSSTDNLWLSPFRAFPRRQQRPSRYYMTRSLTTPLLAGQYAGDDSVVGSDQDNVANNDTTTDGEVGSITGSSDEGNASQTNTQHSKQQLKGRATLCFVALLYGTLNVSLRLIYQLPDPPTASALSASRGILACVGFLPLMLVGKRSSRQPREINSISANDATTSSPPSLKSLLWAGLELAFWNFVAQGLLNVALLSTSSARASFLTQTSVVFTPVLSWIFGQSVPPNIWVACGFALVGLTVLSSTGASAMFMTGGGAAGAGSLSFLSSLVQFSTGDWFVLGAALSWSMYLFRVSKIGGKFNEVKLQFIKSVLLAILYAIWLLLVLFFQSRSISLLQQPQPFGWLMNVTAFLTLFYSAVGPGTVADVLQQQGQKEVSASEANVILSLEPVFTALCAWLILGESTSVQEAVGGGIILGAALLATTGR